jgi:acetyl-CoA carboxylase biotin carboxyl carrier protein
VTTIEFPKRDEQPEDRTADITLAELRAQTRELAGELPGTLRRITLRAGALSVDVEWEGAPQQPYAPPAYYQPAPAPQPVAPQPAAAQPAAAQPPQAGEAGTSEAAAPKANTIAVTAPLVGTFYRAPSPTAEPYVKIGDVVEPGQPLAIVEAMKLLNNITSEHGGKVVAIHVDNGDIVEYGQALLDLEPVD